MMINHSNLTSLIFTAFLLVFFPLAEFRLSEFSQSVNVSAHDNLPTT